MCAVRNVSLGIEYEKTILDHWEMCAVRNLAGVCVWLALNSRSLGDVRCPERETIAVYKILHSRSLGDVRCPEQ